MGAPGRKQLITDEGQISCKSFLCNDLQRSREERDRRRRFAEGGSFAYDWGSPRPRDGGPAAGRRSCRQTPSGLRAKLRMWRTRSVRLNVRLPDDVSVLAEELQQSDPDFMNWIVQYGLTRRSIYDQMRDGERKSPSPPPTLA